MLSLRRASLRALHLVVPSARALRMAAYSLFAFGALAAAASRSVYADAREMGISVGHQLTKLEDLTGAASLVRVNGAELHRASARTPQSTREVLDRYEAHCRKSPGTLGRVMRDIPTALADRIDLSHDDRLRASIVRDEHDGRGMVVCFVDDEDASSRGLVEKLRAVVDTGDLSKLGRFRYVFAEPSRSSEGGTHVVTFWCDGELNVQKMFPASGDAPGTDSALAPRPAQSRRTLSASVEGYPAAVRVYESSARRPEIERAMDAALRAKRFRRVAAKDAHVAAYAREDDAQIIVSFGERAERTTVTVVEGGASPTRGIQVEVVR
ncbi:MAG: hypothetical protein KF819_39590 [Labilithrix sp.]|nr:hypothetical protein [Labilithrix sp.]